MNKDACKSCGSSEYFYWRMVAPANPKFDCYEECSDCSKRSIPNLSPDVYFDASRGSNQTDPNLCGRNGVPIPFSSKREKAAIMQSLGVREAGDKRHGARNFDKSASKQWDHH